MSGDPRLIPAIVPGTIAAAEAFDDAAALPLYPEERRVVAGAVEKRRLEFTTVRTLARACLSRLGQPPRPLMPDRDRAPQWPVGFVGSMTHCEGYRAAAVARSRDVLALGIDAEPHDALPAGVLDAVSLPAERRSLVALAGAHPEVAWDRLLFSAKESVFKAWFPLTRRWLDFSECAIEFDPEGGTFFGRLLVPGHPLPGGVLESVSGRWVVSAEHVATALVVLGVKTTR